MAQQKPPITGTTHTLPFERLSPLDFERLCLALLAREGFDTQHYGAAGGEQGRDIVAHCHGELWYVQCKRVKECGPQVLLDEVEKVLGLIEDDPDLHPVGMLFMVCCDVSATARDRAGKRCAELGLACKVWGRTDLDSRLQPHADVIETFFGRQILHPGIPFLHRLQPPPGDFRGRTNESANLLAALERTRGAVISGLGGVGKTALALVLAERLAPRYPDAQLYFNLRGTTSYPLSATDVMTYVISAFQPDVRIPESEDELSGWYHSVLYGKRAILLMDNAVNAEQVAPLVPPSSCVLLITSRRYFTLPGLFSTKLSPLPPADARALLLAIAPRIGGHAGTIAELCGYLPLALRLAGKALIERIDLSPADYVRQLREAQSLELIDASLNLSYDLLGAELQRLCCMLAVFPDTFDSQAASAVCGLEPDVAQDALSALVVSSLVEWNQVTLHYHLHDLVRLFADAHLGTEDRKVARERHARYYVRLAQKADRLLAAGQELEALTALDTAWPNICAAHSFLVQSSSLEVLELLYQLHTVLDQYSNRRGLWDEHAEMLETSVHAMRDFGIVSHGLGRLEIQLGALYRRQSRDYEVALEYCQAGLDRLYADGTPQDPSAAEDYRRLGDTYRVRGEFAHALKCYHVAEQLLEGERYAGKRGQLLSSIAEAYARSGLNLERALRVAEESLSLQQKLGDKYEAAQSHRILADVHLSRGEIDPAAYHIGEARSSLEELEEQRNPLMGWVLRTQGEVYRLRSDAESAIACYEQALALFSGQHIGVGVAVVLEKMGWLSLQLNDAESALLHLDQAVNRARTVRGARYAQAGTLLSRIEADIVTGHADERTAAYLDELNMLIEDGDDLAVFRARLAYLLKQSRIAVGVATSVSASENFDPPDTLSYAAEHIDFRLIQVFLNEQIIPDRLLRQELAEAAHRRGIRLMCHAPGLLSRDTALDSTTIAAACDLLRHSPEKWVVYHLDEKLPLSETLDLVTELARAGLVPCIENYHRVKTPEKGRQHYELYCDLFRMIHEHGLNACAVLDIPRLFDSEVELAHKGEAVRLVSEVVQCLDDLGVRIILHLIDSRSFDLDRSNWCPLGAGAIPYDELLKPMFASTARIEAVIFEFEDKRKPLESLPFLYECIRDGVSVHHPALDVRWWG
jgi:tetratricopeptide (TPR) repeat protein